MKAVRMDFTTASLDEWMAHTPVGGFDVILADPAWRYSSNSAANPGKNAMAQYPCMRIAQICAMPVNQIVARDALLLLWVTVPFAKLADQVVEAWGFKYVSQLVWLKNTIAMGHWARGAHELVYICRRRKFQCVKPALFPTSIIPGRNKRHSGKPEWVQDHIDARLPDATKAELFARRPRTGWTVFGNEVGEAAA